MDRVVRENPKFRSSVNEVVSAINVFTGIQIPINRERGVVDMCKAWEDHGKSGLKEGRIEGEIQEWLRLLQDLVKSRTFIIEEYKIHLNNS